MMTHCKVYCLPSVADKTANLKSYRYKQEAYAELHLIRTAGVAQYSPMSIIHFLWLLQVPRASATFVVTDSYSQGTTKIGSLPSIQIMTANSSLMQVDAIGDSTQPQSALSALPAQAASSDDCSAVKSPSSDPAQNGATSTPQQPAAVKPSAAQNAHLAAASPKLQQHPSLQLQTAAPSSNWHLRKRKQAPSGEEQQHATLGRSTPDSAAAEQDVAGSTEQDSLEPDLSHRKGKRKGSKVSGGPTEALPKGQGRAAPSASGWSLSNLVVSLPVHLAFISLVLLCVCVFLCGQLQGAKLALLFFFCDLG